MDREKFLNQSGSSRKRSVLNIGINDNQRVQKLIKSKERRKGGKKNRSVKVYTSCTYNCNTSKRLRKSLVNKISPYKTRGLFEFGRKLAKIDPSASKIKHSFKDVEEYQIELRKVKKKLNCVRKCETLRIPLDPKIKGLLYKINRLCLQLLKTFKRKIAKMTMDYLLRKESRFA